MRDVGALIAGLVAGVLVNMLVLQLTGWLSPMPEDLDPTEPAALAAWMDGLPISVMLLVMVGHLGQALVGAAVAARISVRRPLSLGMAIGVLTLLGGVGNLLMLPHPPWMWLEVLLYLPAAWVGVRLALQGEDRR